MPHDASSLLLEVTAVRVERFHDISEAHIVSVGVDMGALLEAYDSYYIAKDGNFTGRRRCAALGAAV